MGLYQKVFALLKAAGHFEQGALVLVRESSWRRAETRSSLRPPSADSVRHDARSSCVARTARFAGAFAASAACVQAV